MDGIALCNSQGYTGDTDAFCYSDTQDTAVCDEYTNMDGINARQACCVCGGGTTTGTDCADYDGF